MSHDHLTTSMTVINTMTITINSMAIITILRARARRRFWVAIAEHTHTMYTMYSGIVGDSIVPGRIVPSSIVPNSIL